MVFLHKIRRYPTALAWNAGMCLFGLALIIMFVGAFRRTFDYERLNARIDHLTGVSNRRAFEIDSRRLEASCRRDNRTLMCGLIDIDDFKTVNDKWGHDYGDVALRYLAEALSDALRAYDVTARMRGDEFAFCLAVRDMASAMQKS